MAKTPEQKTNSVKIEVCTPSKYGTYRRAGIGFTSAWQPIEVDSATLEILKNDPHIKVRENKEKI